MNTQPDPKTKAALKAQDEKAAGKVGFFASCLVDLYRPSVGFASVDLLHRAGFDVVVPSAQTCCGQPAYNAGAQAPVQAIARQNIDMLEAYEHVVVPSASCAGMMVKHYPLLFGDDPIYAHKARQLSARTYELTQFLTRHPPAHIDAADSGKTLAYHPSCSSLRELHMSATAPALLARTGKSIVELKRADVCCGFGGAFSVKYADVSGAMAAKKCADIEESGADILVSCDLGCLLHLSGRLLREGKNVEVRHIAEILAGCEENGPIGGAGT